MSTVAIFQRARALGTAVIMALLAPASSVHHPHPGHCPNKFGPPILQGLTYSLDDLAMLPGCTGWAVGFYNNFAVQRRGALIERWDGTGWTPQKIPGSLALQAVSATSANNAWAVGVDTSDGFSEERPAILRWNGATWQAQPSAPSIGGNGFGSLSAISAASQGDAWAVGGNTVTGTLAEHWNGSSWQVYPVPRPHHFGAVLNGVVTLAPNDAWATGNAFPPDGAERALIEHWNGTSWQPANLPRPNPGRANYLQAIAAVSASNVWAVGSYDDDGTYRPMALHWNGAAWRLQRMPSPPGKYVVLTSLTMASASQGWAVGYIGRDDDKAFAEHWNGTTWRRITRPIHGQFLVAAANSPQAGTWILGKDFNHPSQIFALHCCPWRTVPPEPQTPNDADRSFHGNTPPVTGRHHVLDYSG